MRSDTQPSQQWLRVDRHLKIGRSSGGPSSFLKAAVGSSGKQSSHPLVSNPFQVLGDNLEDNSPNAVAELPQSHQAALSSSVSKAMVVFTEEQSREPLERISEVAKQVVNAQHADLDTTTSNENVEGPGETDSELEALPKSVESHSVDKLDARGSVSAETNVQQTYSSLKSGKGGPYTSSSPDSFEVFGLARKVRFIDGLILPRVEPRGSILADHPITLLRRHDIQEQIARKGGTVSPGPSDTSSTLEPVKEANAGQQPPTHQVLRLVPVLGGERRLLSNLRPQVYGESPRLSHD